MPRPFPGRQTGERAIGTVPPQANTRPAQGALELSAPETARDIGIFSVAEHLALLRHELGEVMDRVTFPPATAVTPADPDQIDDDPYPVDL
jgi:hypothetical protein